MVYNRLTNIEVLNLIITGIPSIPLQIKLFLLLSIVLNLIITGIPSIQYNDVLRDIEEISFKSYYNWNTFNTWDELKSYIITELESFKPYYNWNTFNTIEVISLAKAKFREF